jgi:hypothetical protein
MAKLTPDLLVSLYKSAGPEGDSPPLKDLSKFDWSAVSHAHGPATDIPALLRALISGNADHREFAWQLLCETIWHQGDVYEATPLAVPFLYNLLEADGQHDKTAIAYLLANIADGQPPISSRCEGGSKEARQWRLIFTNSGKNLEFECEKERRYHGRAS